MGLILNELSMLPVHPVLHSFPVVGVYSSVDIYTVMVEPMNVLSLSISRLQKECLKHMLSNDKETTNAMSKPNRDPKLFSRIRESFFLS